MSKVANPELAKMLQKYSSSFAWDSVKHTWCLCGTENGNAWETDDYAAKNETQAELDAILYLENYNTPE